MPSRMYKSAANKNSEAAKKKKALAEGTARAKSKRKGAQRQIAALEKSGEFVSADRRKKLMKKYSK